MSTNKPSLKCDKNTDKFTVSNEIGNGKLTYTTGLITFDEYRGHWLENTLNFANDFGYFQTEIGVVGVYRWSIEYNINKESIWMCKYEKD